MAKRMQAKEFTDWERVFVALDDAAIAGYCTFLKTDCVPDVEFTPFIGFVFVDENYRGRRLSEKMIQQALSYARKLGFTQVYLVSGEIGLYEKYGFTVIDHKKDLWGNEEQIFSIKI